MNSNTEKLKEIFNYCKTHKHIDERYYERPCTGELNAECVLHRNCIESNKRSRYNDPRFVNKCYDKVVRALAKEREKEESDPFAEFKD